MLMTNERPPAIRRCADGRSRWCIKPAPSANAKSTAGYDAKVAAPRGPSNGRCCRSRRAPSTAGEPRLG
jgi:hypothetical protein